MVQKWEVVGGSGNGILVREGQALDSHACTVRLSTGAIVEELGLLNGRLQFKLINGSGPESGWVTIKLKDGELLVRRGAAHAAKIARPNMLHALWIAADIDKAKQNARSLNDACIRVHFCTSACAALDGAGRTHPDLNELVLLVTSELWGQGMDGRQLLDEVRFRLFKKFNSRARPVLALTCAARDSLEFDDHGADVIWGDSDTESESLLRQIADVIEQSHATRIRSLGVPLDCGWLRRATSRAVKEVVCKLELPKNRATCFWDESFKHSTCHCKICVEKQCQPVSMTNSVRICTSLDESANSDNWLVAYHGTTLEAAISIVVGGAMVLPGERSSTGCVHQARNGQAWAGLFAAGGLKSAIKQATDSGGGLAELAVKSGLASRLPFVNSSPPVQLEGQSAVLYFTPSIQYAKNYSLPCELGGRKIEAVVEVRVHPGAIAKFPLTVPFVDRECNMLEMEWLVRDPLAVKPTHLILFAA